jgi:membrane protease YdiL (CAAX protease family)
MRAFAWFLALILVALSSIAAFTYPVWLLLHPQFDFPFHRIGERIAMLVLALCFALVARRLGLADRASLGYGLPRGRFLEQMAVGVVLGVVTMSGVVGLMTALGLLDWAPAARIGAGALAGLVFARMLSGLAVAFIEETFLRGAMHTAIEREAGTGAAVVLTAALYSATHFLAGYRIPASQVSARSGLDLLGGTLHVLAHPLGVADAMLCLFAVGIVLGSVRAATGNIAACIGLHAGWVWVMLVVHELAAPVRDGPGGFLLSRFDGFLGWLVMAWTILVGFGLRRFYASGGQAMGASMSSR